MDVCYHLKSTSKSLTTLDVISTFFLGNHVTSRDMKRKTTVFLASSVKGWSCKFLPELHPCPSIILARKLTVQAKEILFCTHQLWFIHLILRTAKAMFLSKKRKVCLFQKIKFQGFAALHYINNHLRFIHPLITVFGVGKTLYLANCTSKIIYTLCVKDTKKVYLA